MPPPLSDAQETSLAAFSAYDLPSVEALVRYFHAAAGFPVKDTWLAAIKQGNYDTWPGLTYNNAAKYCPSANETLKGHMVQTRQGVRSTKPKKPATQSPAPEEQPPEKVDQSPSQELFVQVVHTSKLYTDDCGRFPIKARSGNQYLMIAYHRDSNAILCEPFKTRADKHRLQAYDAIMQRLSERGLHVDLQILDNEASKEFKQLMKSKWKVSYQLVPPNVHRRNAAERAIRTFKAHFLSILAGVSPDFPANLWDRLLPQAEMTLNFLRQSRINPKISAWEFYNGPFDFDATPLGPLGCRVIIHKKTDSRQSWDFRGKDGWSVGVSLEHYRCQRVDWFGSWVDRGST